MATPKTAQTKVDTGIAPPQTQAAPAVTAAATALQANRVTFALEDSIPYPTRTFGGTRTSESKYPFATMAVGQSFYVPPTDTMAEPWKTLTSLASRECRKQHPKVFVTGKETRDGKQGVRVWRKDDTTEPLKDPKKRAAKGTAEPQTEAQPEPKFA